MTFFNFTRFRSKFYSVLEFEQILPFIFSEFQQNVIIAVLGFDSTLLCSGVPNFDNNFIHSFTKSEKWIRLDKKFR